jgi:hypothetical protein
MQLLSPRAGGTAPCLIDRRRGPEQWRNGRYCTMQGPHPFAVAFSMPTPCRGRWCPPLPAPASQGEESRQECGICRHWITYSPGGHRSRFRRLACPGDTRSCGRGITLPVQDAMPESETSRFSAAVSNLLSAMISASLWRSESRCFRARPRCPPTRR